MASTAAVLNIIVSAQTGQATAALARVDKQLKGTAASGKGATTGVTRVGKAAEVAGKVGAAALAYGLYKSVRVGMDFEKQMSSLGAVTGASGRQMDQFKKQALEMGQATIFGARDVVQAQTELAKGGLTAKQILGGALPAALNLAAAGELDLATAANTTANAMSLFGLKGKQAGQVADMLATAANSTTADVADFAMALTQGGSAAKQVGYSLNDTVVVLEALAKAGIKNSDAGTSMKTALLQLVAPTARQTEMARKLGLTFTDQAGNMKDPIQLAGELRKATEGMTKAQRTAAFKVLAGTDGFRTLASLYDLGSKNAQKFADANEKTGTAAETASKKTDNLAGDLERLKGALETKGIEIFDDLKPHLRKATQFLSSTIENMKPIEWDNVFGDAVTPGGRFGRQLRNGIQDAFEGFDINDLLGSSIDQATDSWGRLMSGFRAAATFKNGFSVSVKELKLMNEGMTHFADLTKQQVKNLQGLAVNLPTEQLKRFFDAAKGEGVGKAVNQIRRLAGTKVATHIGLTGNAEVTRQLGAVASQAAKLGNKRAVVKILASNESAMTKLRQLQAYVDKMKGKTLDVKAKDGASGPLRTINAELNAIHDKTFTVTMIKKVAGDVGGFATGVRNSTKEGVGVVGERGRELARFASGAWTMLGERGPHLFPVERGMDIFTASETRKLLAAGIPGFKDGKKGKPKAKATGNPFEAALAAAELTETLSDDIAAIGSVAAGTGLLGYWSRQAKKYSKPVRMAGKKGKAMDWEKLTEARQEIKRYTDQLTELNSGGTTGSSTDSESQITIALLNQLLAQANLRNAVYQAQKGVLTSTPYVGSFGGGGVVPGPVGAPMLATVHGGETISEGAPQVHLHFANGMQWLERFVTVQVQKNTRGAARGVNRTPANVGANWDG